MELTRRDFNKGMLFTVTGLIITPKLIIEPEDKIVRSSGMAMEIPLFDESGVKFFIRKVKKDAEAKLPQNTRYAIVRSDPYMSNFYVENPPNQKVVLLGWFTDHDIMTGRTKSNERLKIMTT